MTCWKLQSEAWLKVYNLALSTATNDISTMTLSVCLARSDGPKARIIVCYQHHCFGGEGRLSGRIPNPDNQLGLGILSGRER